MQLLTALALILALVAISSRPIEGISQRIGVYDSRSIAIAYANSPSFSKVHGVLGERLKAAKEKGDAKEVAAVEREGMLRQVMMHEQGFGTGSVMQMIATVKDSIAALAIRENVSLVVSKWEVAYSGEGVELVDLTDKITDFFHPSERAKGWLKDVQKQAPIENAYLIQD